MVLGTGAQIHYFFHINNFQNNVQQGIVSQLLLIEAQQIIAKNYDQEIMCQISLNFMK